MKGYEPIMSWVQELAQTFGDDQRGDEAEAVAFLERAARGGPALELGIGAGRIALPLVARGIRVDGVDISPAMVDQMRAKPGGDRISVTIGDLADAPVSGDYRLIYVVYNTLFNVLTQEDQVRCFENVAAHLADDGSFIVEAYSPGFLYRLRDNQYVGAEEIEVDRVTLDVLRHDPVGQRIDENHVTLSREGALLPGGPAVRVAGRARPDGAHRRAAAQGAMGRLEPGAGHGEQRQPGVRLQALSRRPSVPTPAPALLPGRITPPECTI